MPWSARTALAITARTRRRGRGVVLAGQPADDERAVGAVASAPLPPPGGGRPPAPPAPPRGRRLSRAIMARGSAGRGRRRPPPPRRPNTQGPLCPLFFLR